MEATVLTASPYKNSVATRMEMKKSKQSQKEKRQKGRPRATAAAQEAEQGKEQQKSKSEKKSKKAKQQKRKRSKKVAESQANATRCLVCGETNEEDWIQCSKCYSWVHEACADIQNALYYYCDNCVSK